MAEFGKRKDEAKEDAQHPEQVRKASEQVGERIGIQRGEAEHARAQQEQDPRARDGGDQDSQ